MSLNPSIPQSLNPSAAAALIDRTAPAWRCNEAFVTGTAIENAARTAIDVPANVDLLQRILVEGGFGRVLLMAAQHGNCGLHAPEYACFRPMWEMAGKLGAWRSLHVVPQSVASAEFYGRGNSEFNVDDLVRGRAGGAFVTGDGLAHKDGFYKCRHDSPSALRRLELIAEYAEALGADGYYVDNVDATADWFGLEAAAQRVDCLRRWTTGLFALRPIPQCSCVDPPHDPVIASILALVGIRDWKRGAGFDPIGAFREAASRYATVTDGNGQTVPRVLGWIELLTADWRSWRIADLERVLAAALEFGAPLSVKIDLPAWAALDEVTRREYLRLLRSHAEARSALPPYSGGGGGTGDGTGVSPVPCEQQLAAAEKRIASLEQQVAHGDKLIGQYALELGAARESLSASQAALAGANSRIAELTRTNEQMRETIERIVRQFQESLRRN